MRSWRRAEPAGMRARRMRAHARPRRPPSPAPATLPQIQNALSRQRKEETVEQLEGLLKGSAVVVGLRYQGKNEQGGNDDAHGRIIAQMPAPAQGWPPDRASPSDRSG